MKVINYGGTNYIQIEHMDGAIVLENMYELSTDSCHSRIRVQKQYSTSTLSTLYVVDKISKGQWKTTNYLVPDKIMKQL